MSSTVEIRQLTHRYGNFIALQDVSLTVEAGSFTVLLGPSGCGKTTLLSVLGGFIDPTSGAVLLNGTDVTRLPPARRPTTTMFQDYALFPHMNLIDNVAFGLRMRGQSKKQRRAKALELLTLVGLESSTRKKPHALSGGQQQRVALARALAVEPDVLLLDEPLGALDLKLRRQMQDELKSIQKRIGTTFIHVTHDQEEAMAIADQIVVMNNGRIEDIGSPESIYLKPKTVFSATFMGEVNMFEGTVLSIDEKQINIESTHGLLNLPMQSLRQNALNSGDKVQIGFRPEHLQSDWKTNRQTDGHVAGQADSKNTTDMLDLGLVKIEDISFFGAHQRCKVLAANEQTYVVNVPQNVSLAVDEKIPLCINRSSFVLLHNG